ncbi:MAG TPA: hypothetical protein VG935_03150 [Patescibacteria group bacterium]|nr:hypothetical protein [Patescibacteria group bacterium]
MKKDSQLVDDYIDALMETKAVQFRSVDEEPFTLRSGKKSYVYVNHARLAVLARGFELLIDSLADLLTSHYGQQDFILCNVDSKISAQMAGALAYKLNKRQVIFKSDQFTAIEKGPGEQLTGLTSWDDPIAIVDDVTTTGATAKNVAEVIAKTFPKIKDIDIFVGVVRSKGLPELLSDNQRFPLHSVLTLNELLNILAPTAKEEEKKAMRAEQEAK